MAISRLELETFYQQSETPLYNFALRWVWNPALAEEIVQDAFVRLWRRRESIEAPTLKGLAYKTVQNLALNELRKNRIRQSIPLLGWLLERESPDLESEFIFREGLANLQKAMSQLTHELQETLLLCQFSDMSYAEIGQNLGVPEGTVASRKNRAMKILRAGKDAANV
jgi:RNA polymerase sigma-70 factor (ECF subfamily)